MSFSIPNEIEFESEITSAEHQQNYTAIESDLNTEVIRRDGSVAMTGELTLSGTASTATGAVTKAQMDAADAVVDAVADAAQAAADAAQADADAAQAAADAAQSTADTALAQNDPVPCLVDREYNSTQNAGVVTVTLSSTVGGKTMTNAIGVFGSLTVTGTGSGGYVTAYPYSQGSTPTGSQCNFGSDTEPRNGFFFVEVDSSRRFKLYRHARCAVLIDIQGIVYA